MKPARLGTLAAVVSLALLGGAAEAEAQVFVYRVELKEQKGKHLSIKVPDLRKEELPCEYAYVFRISK